MNVINTGSREGASCDPTGGRPHDQTSIQTSAQRRDALLEAIRAQCVEHLLSALRTLFDKAGELMFDLARKSEEYHLKREYLEAMQEIQRQRADMEARCKREFLSAFDQCCRGTSPSVVPPPLPAGPGPVGDTIAGKQPAIAFLVENAERGCETELSALNRRMGVLLGRPDLSTKENPAAPAVIGAAVNGVMSQMQAGGFIHLLLFALLDRHVMARLHVLYGTLNEFLINQQVLPGILMPSQRHAPIPATPADGWPAVAPGGVTSAFLDHPAEPAWLLADDGADSGATAAPATVNMGVVHALTSLQRGGYIAPAEMAVRPAFNVVRDIKIRGLLPPMDQADEARLDLVAMLFDYFLNDTRLPAALRGRIARLQIPILKAAFLDNAFFIRKHHPARRLLNTITRKGVEAAHSPLFLATLLGFVDRVIRRLQNEFEHDAGLFTALHAQLEDDIAAAHRGTGPIGNVAARTSRNQRQQEEAKRKIRGIIDSRLHQTAAGKPFIPEAVRNFILTHWQRLLLRRFLREGAEGGAFNEAVRTMDDLIWSAAARQDDAERARLRQLRPGLVRRLEAGMDELFLPPPTRAGFLTKLSRCLAGAEDRPADENDGSGIIGEDSAMAIAAALLEEPPRSTAKRPDPEEITTPREIYFETRKNATPTDAAAQAGDSSAPPRTDAEDKRG